MLRLVGRLILIPIAFVVAVIVAGLVIVTLGQERIVEEIAARSPADLQNFSELGEWMKVMSVMAAFASASSLLPAVALVIVGEAGSIRSAVFYVIGGGAAVALVPVLTQLSAVEVPGEVTTIVWQVLAVGGFAGGLVYWLLAGRNA